MLKAFAQLAKLRRLRGTRWDIFGRTEERKMERRLIGEYEAVVEDLIAGLDAGNRDLAVEIATVPGEIKGFGHVKEANHRVAKRGKPNSSPPGAIRPRVREAAE